MGGSHSAERTSKENMMVLDETTKFTDMVVVVADDRIPCHKGVICNYSKVIRNAVELLIANGAKEIVFLIESSRVPGANVDNVRQFLLVMYNGWNSAEMDRHLHQIYRLANTFEVPKVMELAAQALDRLLTVENFWRNARMCDEDAPFEDELIAVFRIFISTQSKLTVDNLFSFDNAEFMDAKATAPKIANVMLDMAFRRYQEVMPSFCHTHEVPCHADVIGCPECTKNRQANDDKMAEMFFDGQ